MKLRKKSAHHWESHDGRFRVVRWFYHSTSTARSTRSRKRTRYTAFDTSNGTVVVHSATLAGIRLQLAKL